MAAATWNELAHAHWQGSDEAAVVTEDGALSGNALLGHAAGASGLYDSLGILRGAPIPALVDETPTAIVLAVGGALSGRPLAPLGTRLPTAELVAMTEGLDATHLLAEPDCAAQAQYVARAAGVDLHVVDALPRPAARLGDPGEPNDVVVVVHTSGTTGQAKPILMRQGPMANRVEVYGAALGLGPGDRYCSASPYYHTAGVAMVFTVLGMGAVVIPQDWFSVEGWRRAGSLGMTCALLVPTMIDVLLAEGALADASPRVLQYGAAPIHPATLTEALAVLPDTRFVQIFGQTEVSPVCFLSHDDHLRALAGNDHLLGSAGRVIPRSELCLEHTDPDGIGEIAIRGPHLFAADADGWRRTGDLGRIDEDGYVFLQGRVNDRIIRGGENIYPAEIEAVLTDHPGVREAAVLGIPDRRWGEVVRAAVVPVDPAAPPDASALLGQVEDRLAHFKVPAEVVFVDELPRNPSGKVLRRELR